MSHINGHYSKTNFNRSEIDQSILNIENKNRSNPLTWKAQFSPQLVEALLDKYATDKAVVYDPFVGSGTVLSEAGRKQLRAIGTEINPAAVVLSSFYKLINLKPNKRANITEDIDSKLKSSLLKSANSKTAKDLFRKLLKSTRGSDNHKIVVETLIVLSDFLDSKKPIKKILTTWDKLVKLIDALPYSRRTIDVFFSDARKTSIRSRTIDLVITSPPYINVFNYHQQYRSSVEFLGTEVLGIAKSEIGSNRKHRSNRFLTVIQYCLDMEKVFSELIRVGKEGARLIFIVGRESKIRGTPFNNGELVAEIAKQKFGLKLILKQERYFKNKFGNTIYEDLLHFEVKRKKRQINKDFSSREIASKALSTTLRNACGEIKENIRSAITSIDEVSESPLLKILPG